MVRQGRSVSQVFYRDSGNPRYCGWLASLLAQTEHSWRTLLPGRALAVPLQLFLNPGEGYFELSGGLFEEPNLTLMDLVIAEDDADEFVHEIVAFGAGVLADPGG